MSSLTRKQMCGVQECVGGHLPSLMDIIKANILIDEAKHACLTDFGLLTLMSNTTSLIPSTSFARGGTCRWMSPELFYPAYKRQSKMRGEGQPNHRRSNLSTFNPPT